MDVPETVRLIDAALRSVADPEKAPAMAAYMKHHFAFLGVPKPQREGATKQIVRSLTFVSEAELHELVLALWSGSRALNVFVDTITIMYGLGGHRGIVKTRVLSVPSASRVSSSAVFSCCGTS